MKIAVVGTGYVGSVTGTCFAETGNQVTCVDIDEKKVEMLQNGEVPIYEPGLELLLQRNLKQGRIQFTTNLAEAVKDAEIIFLALPTPPGEDVEKKSSRWYVLRTRNSCRRRLLVSDGQRFRKGRIKFQKHQTGDN